jgi:Lrp/AsnC family leucine-responsive transcriptional regulator
MDKIDIKILNILQKDCTISVKDIAKEVGLSYTPTYERIRTIENLGVIKARASILNPSKVGINLFAYCNVTLKEQSNKNLTAFEEYLQNVPEIMEILSLSGTYDYMLKIATKDIEAYNNFVVHVLSNAPHIGQYHSNIVMNVVKDETMYFLEEPE